MELIRQELEAWLAAYPQGERNRLLGDLTSTIDRQHLAAVAELWTHHVLSRLGFSPVPHPTLTHTPRHPDYGISVTGSPLYVECRLVARDEETTGWETRRNTVLDLLDGLNTEGYLLDVEVFSVGAEPRSTRGLRIALAAWLADLDPGEILAQYDAGRRRDVPTYPWREHGWDVTIRPIPLASRSERVKPLDGGVIGMTGGPVRRVTTSPRIRSAIEKKEPYYGDVGGPLVLVVTTEMRARFEHLVDALFGDPRWLDDQGVREAAGTRLLDGAWLRRARTSGRRVSGILFSGTFGPWSLASQGWTFVHHPDPVYAAPPGMFPFATEVSWHGGTPSYRTATRSLSSLFGLDDSWPGPL